MELRAEDSSMIKNHRAMACGLGHGFVALINDTVDLEGTGRCRVVHDGSADRVLLHPRVDRRVVGDDGRGAAHVELVLQTVEFRRDVPLRRGSALVEERLESYRNLVLEQDTGKLPIKMGVGRRSSTEERYCGVNLETYAILSTEAMNAVDLLVEERGKCIDVVNGRSALDRRRARCLGSLQYCPSYLWSVGHW